jgi:DNA-binding PadR family transcriptional regulator
VDRLEAAGLVVTIRRGFQWVARITEAGREELCRSPSK